mmetsp:Transcript_30024/g.53255  ORF Transcript_30024/g.53255 Transcript_30024/m.53255 type:complete len:108 (-) Transcript_30024:39-362(-)
MNEQFMSLEPVQATCPSCNHQGLTVISTSPGKTAMIGCCVMCVLGCWLCCFIPCCMKGCRDTNHKCSKCKKVLGTFKLVETIEKAAVEANKQQLKKQADDHHPQPQA